LVCGHSDNIELGKEHTMVVATTERLVLATAREKPGKEAALEEAFLEAAVAARAQQVACSV
jgi:hypothetical protein